MFQPMALTVIFALVAAFVLSLTFVPGDGRAAASAARSQETENFLVRVAKRAYEPALALARCALRWAVVGARRGAVRRLSLLLFARLGQEFVPTLDEQDIAMHAMRIPSTGITQSTEMQLEVERALARVPRGGVRLLARPARPRWRRDPMPPNVSDTFIILKPHERVAGSRATRKDGRARARRGSALARRCSGNNYEFTQPIQMRFNELIAGVRSDVAVKVYGDDFEQMQPTARADRRRPARRSRGAADVKVEQTEGLPMMNVDDRPRSDRALRPERRRRAGRGRRSPSAGARPGQVFEGDRRFDLVVRLPETRPRRPARALEDLPIPLPHDATSRARRRVGARDGATSARGPAFVPLGAVATIDVAEGPNQISRENGKRRIVVQANVRGRDIGSFVAEAQARDRRSR